MDFRDDCNSTCASSGWPGVTAAMIVIGGLQDHVLWLTTVACTLAVSVTVTLDVTLKVLPVKQIACFELGYCQCVCDETCCLANHLSIAVWNCYPYSLPIACLRI
jgi:hypothetical protein